MGISFYAAVTELAEEQACLDLADLILETAQKVDVVAQANAAPGDCLVMFK